MNPLVLKNNAGNNVTFAPIYGSSSASQWAKFENASGAFSIQRPFYLQRLKDMADKKVHEIKLRMPYCVTDATGATVLVDSLEFNGSFRIPSSVPVSQIPDLVALVASALSDANVKGWILNGVSPN